MRRLLSIVILTSWALWLGGLIVLFMAVGTLFAEFPSDHATAGRVGAHLFRIFNIYHLSLAGILLIGLLLAKRSRASWAKALTFIFCLAAGLAAVSLAFWLTPHIETLRLNGGTHTPEFAKLHGWSMSIFMAETGLLLVGGFFLPSVMRAE